MTSKSAERDTIAAIATAPGPAGVAIVRVSGSDAFSIAERLTGKFVVPGRILHCRIFGDLVLSPQSSVLSRTDHGPRVTNHEIDDAVVLAFKGPASYTGEDVVEFQCHGGAVVPKQVLEATFAAGARLARRGEFTERAFLNGKLTYEQAEGVLNLVNAKTERAAAAAREGISGAREERYRGIYAAALQLSATFEHALDVSEEELPEDFRGKCAAQQESLRARVRECVRYIKEGHILREGALVVLAGEPNVGKSSLMNAILGENRVIVSDIPGTTRDSIEEWVDIEGWPIRLVDTAGIRETGDKVEAEGVKRSNELICAADVVLALDCEINGAIRVHSKCDLGPGEGINVSAVTKEGLEGLKKAIIQRLEAKIQLTDHEPRTENHDLAVLISVEKSLEGPIDDLVLAANRVRSAAERIGQLIGAVYSEDLLTSLFSRFCVGK